MKKYSLHIVCLLALLFPFFAGRGQGPHDHSPPVLLKASVDQQKILIGQPLHFLLEATVTGNAPLSWPVLDSLPHFQILEKGNIDSVMHSDDRYYRQSLTITSFDSGAWAIPRLLFMAGGKRAISDSVRIEVVFSKFDPNKDYHDIRDIVDAPNPFEKWFGWIVAAVSLLSLSLVIWMVGRKKLIVVSAPSQAAAVPALPPHEEALARLNEMAKQGAWENSPAKLYYTRLNDILRLFVLRRLEIASMAETNEELIGQLRRLPLEPAAFARLSQVLRMSDFVKFAKYQPAVVDKEESFRDIRDSIEELNRIAITRDNERMRQLAQQQEITNNTMK